MPEVSRPKVKLLGFTALVFSALYALIVLFAVTFLFVALPIISLVCVLVTSQKQTLHNIIAKTSVYQVIH